MQVPENRFGSGGLNQDSRVRASGVQYVPPSLDALLRKNRAAHDPWLSAHNPDCIRTSTAVDERIVRVQRFVLRNLHRRISLADAARIACLEKHYFAALFRRKTLKTFGEWLREQRVHRAIVLLATGKRSIGHVAHEVGYRDWTGLERAFRKTVCMSPVKVRKLIRENELSQIEERWLRSPAINITRISS